MNIPHPKLFCLALFVIIAGCAVGPVEEPEDKSEPKGPGLFSGTDGDFSFNKYFSDDAKEERRKNKLYGTGYNVDIPAIDQQSFEDFENFKAWRRAQEPGSENYQEYQDWRAYQQYLRFKDQKEGATAPSQ